MSTHESSAYAAAMRPGSNLWFGLSMILLGLIGGYFIGFNTAQSMAGTQQVAQAPSAPAAPTGAAAAPTQPTGTAPTPGVGPTIGDKNAKVTLIEYTDFQCPFCGQHFTNSFGQIKKDYVDTGKIKYEIRNFPLTSIHPNAMIGAEAAMCADQQGKFWDMHDKLFSNQASWSNESAPSNTLKQYAADIKLDTGKFASCLDGHETQAAIQQQETDAGAAGIDGTPGFWLIGPDGKTSQISGARPYASFQASIDAMLK